MDSVSARNRTSGRSDCESAHHDGVTLCDVIEQWQTPSGQMFTSRMQVGDEERQPLLPNQAEMWATPNATDDRRGNTGYSQKQLNRPEGAPKILNHQVASWDTPNTDRRGTEPPELTQAEYWPTPNARDHKGSDLESRNGGASLSHAVETGEFSHSRSSRLVPVISTDGSELSPTDPSTSERRRLNPAFVCWLMAWPWWWTRAERISFAAQEMESYRSKLRSHLSSLLVGRE